MDNQLLDTLLTNYLKEKITITKELKRHGIIDLTLCDKCTHRTIFGIEKFPLTELESKELLEYIVNNQIKNISSNSDSINIECIKTPLFGLKGSPYFNPGSKLVSLKKLKSKNYGVFNKFFEYPITQTDTCEHFKTIDDLRSAELYILKRKKLPPRDIIVHSSQGGSLVATSNLSKLVSNSSEDQYDSYLNIFCHTCAEKFQHRGCLTSIKDDGVLYTSHCPIDSLVFLHEGEKLEIDLKPVSSNSDFFMQSRFSFYSEKYNIIFDNMLYRDLKDYIDVLEPESIVRFGTKGEICKILSYKTNKIILIEETGNLESPFNKFVYDKTKPINMDIKEIFDLIKTNLEFEVQKFTGKEHDRLIHTFSKFGKDLGFLVENEFTTKGARVDVVWINMEGNVEVAIEIETSTNWKKDVMTTWELKPKLGIILAHYKSSKGIEAILEFSPLQAYPFPLIFINHSLKKIHLIEHRNLLLSESYGTSKEEFFEKESKNQEN